MKKESIEVYGCSFCNHKYNNKENALDCEKNHKKIKEFENIKEFEIKDYHLKLLKSMYISWNDCEFGAPTIDPKRPYGNSNVEDDLAEILSINKDKKTIDYNKEEVKEYASKEEYFSEAEWNDSTLEYLFDRHKEMEIVLQIVLSNLSFDKGKYKKINYKWVKQ